MAMILDPRQLPLVEMSQILEVDADGIIENVEIVGTDFITTFFRITMPFGFAEPIRVPVLRVRRPVLSYQPNQLNSLLMREKNRIGGTKLVN